MINIKALNKYYNKNRSNEIHVINDINLELPDKGMVAVFGKSGCGKTTLLNAIGGLDRTDSGSILIDGENIAENTDVIRNKYIGYIFQNYNLNVLENNFENVADALRLCGVADKDEIERRTIAALTSVGMEKYKYRYPNTLSGGQQQRIAIARAIVKGPRIILADEPTGNLDEANTIMIMNMLKKISENHLVLIVTHEANLVDYYCDKVIELSDGQVINIRENTNTSGYHAKSKNDIYLGELDKETLSNEDVNLEFYGNKPSEPIKLKIVNSSGKLYIRIDTPKVQVLDAASEVKLREGVFSDVQAGSGSSDSHDMTELTPINGKNYGRLFTFVSSLKSGYRANFSKNKKKRAALMRVCMFFFSIVLVIMCATNATAFRDYAEINDSYNHNVFYVYIPNASVADRLAAAKGTNGIEYTRINVSSPVSLYNLRFISGNFETFNNNSFYSGDFLTSPVTFVDMSLAQGLPLVVGKNTELGTEEILITTVVADNILKTSNLGYIKEYKDLIGLISSNFNISGKYIRIAGIVESNENSVFLTERTMAEYILGTMPTKADTADRINLSVNNGETILMLRDDMYLDKSMKYPSVGDTVKIHGMSFTVSQVVKEIDGYENWCEYNGITLPEYDFWSVCVSEAAERYPYLDEGSQEFNTVVTNMYNAGYYEYIDGYYAYLDQYLDQLYAFRQDDIDLWLINQKGEDCAKLRFIEDQEYLRALEYKKVYGKFPTIPELSMSAIPNAEVTYNNVFTAYKEEFYNSSYSYIDQCLYLLGDQDFNSLAYSCGTTDITASGYYYVNNSDVNDYDSQRMGRFMLVYSNDTEATENYLMSEFSDMQQQNNPYDSNVITPTSIFDELIKFDRVGILNSLLFMLVFLVIMSLCMFFIMRSSLMNRVKEIGIYRAIGVSRSNILFRFLVESFVLTTLTVFIGFAVSSGILFVWLGSSPLMSTILYYPGWLALALLIILYAVCLFCGCLPILGLMSKTPSEILSKYDI